MQSCGLICLRQNRMEMGMFLAILQLMWFWLTSLLAQTPPGDGDDDDSDDNDDGDDADDDDSDDDDDDEDENIRDPKAKLAAEKQKNERITKKLKAEEKARKDLEGRLKQLEDAGKSEDEKTRTRLQELEESDKEKNAHIARLTATNALLANSEIAALPPDRRRLVIRMLQDEVEIDDDGADNVDELLGGAKERDPILFVLKDDDDEDDADDSKRRPSGKPVGSKKRKDRNGVDEAALKRRLPAIRT